MTRAMSIKVLVGAFIVLSSGAVVIFLSKMNAPHFLGSSQTLLMAPAPPIVYTAAWYVAHPDMLKADEQRCAGDALNIPQAACQNVASADAQLSGEDYAKAAAVLNSGASGSNVKTPKSQ
jgi:hypothetical protein